MRYQTINSCALLMTSLSSFGAVAYAGAAGPTVGNPEVNEASEEPEPRTPMAATRSASPAAVPASKIYAVVEGKHVLNDYFDREGHRISRKPAFHAKLQLGARLYGDRLDLSVNGGAVKLPAGQSMYQKRPELNADVYVIKTQAFNLLWYNQLQFPVKEMDRDPTEFTDSDLYEQDSKRGIDSTVYTIGLAPIVKYDWRPSVGKLQVRAGADGWTKMYSKPLYVDDSNAAQGESLGLVKSGEDEVEKPFEDRAMRYVHQESLGVAWTPWFAQSANLDIGAHIESRYIPQYYRDQNESWAYTYYPERTSFWRTRLTYDINSTFSVQDEFFVYRNGFFANDRYDTERRSRNVVKLTAKL